mmetsp:Transcript_4050/g.14488  ORF Transcript_4050/g.14488 Transcript_4050/m.14488 type:complete len:209 (-) Transcript_4050:2012-2638(-)
MNKHAAKRMHACQLSRKARSRMERRPLTRVWLLPRASSPKASSTSLRLCSCSFRMRSSTVARTVKRNTRTSRVCPIRWVRSMACSSVVGFHQQSSRKTLRACIMLSPRLAALSDMIITVTSARCLKSRSAASRRCTLIVPSSLRNTCPCSLRWTSSRSSMEVHCEKMMTFSSSPVRAASARIAASCCSTDSSLLDSTLPLLSLLPPLL